MYIQQTIVGKQSHPIAPWGLFIRGNNTIPQLHRQRHIHFHVHPIIRRYLSSRESMIGHVLKLSYELFVIPSRLYFIFYQTAAEHIYPQRASTQAIKPSKLPSHHQWEIHIAQRISVLIFLKIKSSSKFIIFRIHHWHFMHERLRPKHAAKPLKFQPRVKNEFSSLPLITYAHSIIKNATILCSYMVIQ